MTVCIQNFHLKLWRNWDVFNNVVFRFIERLFVVIFCKFNEYNSLNYSKIKKHHNSVIQWNRKFIGIFLHFLKKDRSSNHVNFWLTLIGTPLIVRRYLKIRRYLVFISMCCVRVFLYLVLLKTRRMISSK